MSLQRTTFSESWYRLADLKPIIHPSLNICRHIYRGELWFIIEDSVNNQYFRVTYPAYQFLSLLDGKTTIDTVWYLCMESFGDESPTQGEVLQLLGQLYNSNLLLGDLPADSQGLLLRYKERIKKEVAAKLKGFMFIKIPLWDPDRFLTGFKPLVSWIFSPVGAVIWILLAVTGAIYAFGEAETLMQNSSTLLSISNLPYLYIGFALSKLLHEFGHAFACKKFGSDYGSGGEVHKMGIMFLVFTPLPFVDCSSSWVFRNKWHKIVVGAAGMLIDLAIAAVFVAVWAETSEGSLLNSLAYNIVIATSVATLLFNGNPLMRYDAYYILSDFLEISNFASRSNTYFLYLCRRYILGVDQARCPTHDKRERLWLSFYAVGSFLYRLLVLSGISIFLANFLFILGVVFGITIVWGMLIKPLYKFFHYIAFDTELRYSRNRAFAVTFTAITIILCLLMIIKMPDRIRIEGVVEPVRSKAVYTLYKGFLDKTRETGYVEKGDVLVQLKNRHLVTELELIKCDMAKNQIEFRLAEKEDIVKAQVLKGQLIILKESALLLKKNIKALLIHAGMSGLWINMELDERIGEYMQQGTEVGLLIDESDFIIRAVVNQDHAQLLNEPVLHTEFCKKKRPGRFFNAKFIKLLPVGLEDLPSAALSILAGGEILVKQDEESGRKSVENIFEIHIKPEKKAMESLLSGQVLMVRCSLEPKPMGLQIWRFMKQQFLKRFRVI
jgi:putative peptide zinc metalloprotease protein